MAIKKTVSFKGILAPDTYFKINRLTVLPGNEWMEFNVDYIAAEFEEPFNSVNLQCAYSLLGENPVKQGYEYMKTLEDFAGAEDC